MENLDLIDVRKFVGIKFENFGDSNDVIPKKWITKWEDKVKKCKWPKVQTASLSRNNVDIKKEWHSYKFIPLCHSSKLYSSYYNIIYIFFFHEKYD